MYKNCAQNKNKQKKNPKRTDSKIFKENTFVENCVFNRFKYWYQFWKI